MKKFISIFLLFIFCFCWSQESENAVNEQESSSEYFDLDLVIKNEATSYNITEDSISADLRLIEIYSLPKFNNELDRYQYDRLKDKVYTLYPYLVIAVEEYTSLQDSIKLNKDNVEFKKYIRERQKELSDKYEEKLKKLTKTEGKIFSKLMHRSTGKTVFEIIKELRSGWSAFWWNAKAGAVNIDLKEPYDPYHIRDDAFVEAILLRAYQFRDLEPIKKSVYQ